MPPGTHKVPIDKRAHALESVGAFSIPKITCYSMYMLSAKIFEERYENLNKEQKLAVDTIEGPVLVVAGPGTGKTEILTLRIANILKKTDTAPENILALTFTDAASANMRRRLSQLIGAFAYRVNIETFHSFCNKVIKDYPEYFPTIIGSGNITEVEGVAILEELINKLTLDILRPWGEPLYYIKDVYKKIEELKREGVTPEKFTEIISVEERKFKSRDDLYHEKGVYKGKMKGEHRDFERLLQKNLELSMIYSAYQKSLSERRLYDWSDMIMEVLQALNKHVDLKQILQENHQYILVDEHQDTNNAQNKILELLCDFHKNPNIFIVGDEKQAIFRFQGASIENFNYFKKLYPKAKLVSLEINYRSGQEILDGAHSLIPSNKPLLSEKSAKKSKIQLAEFSDKNSEMYFVADKIKNLIEKEKVLPEEISVIYRSNKEVFALADILDKEKVKYVIESDEDLLGELFVRKILVILEAIFRYGQDSYLVPVLHIEEFGIEPLEAYRLMSNSGKTRTPLYDLLGKSSDKAIYELNSKLKIWVKQSKIDHLTQFLERILRESGMLESMITSRDAEAFLGIERLFEEGKRISANRPGASLADFMEYINIVKERKLFIKRPKHNIERDSVRLMTAHRSKGLEFEHVFITNATEKSFGEKSDRDALRLVPAVYLKDTPKTVFDVSTTEDERRLFYVSLTRAKKSVTITYARADENGKEILPSPFILEIRPDRKEIISVLNFEKNLKSSPGVFYKERVYSGAQAIDKEFVSKLFHSHPLSVTALNNYISCPWKYFYRNLLRIPSSPEKHQIYGIAMHGAVEDLWRRALDRDVDKKFLLDSYKRHLGILGILNPKEFKEALKRGTTALSGWFLWARPTINNSVISEFVISGVELKPGIILGGKLDKVEMLTEKKVLVTDYKTGKQKSRNFIEGKTKEKNMDMFRQLQFYKLILGLHDNIEMQKGIIEFLEPSDSGKYSREEFEVSDVDVLELKETIKRIVNEITTLAFWNKVCDDKDCQYCAYRKLIK